MNKLLKCLGAIPFNTDSLNVKKISLLLELAVVVSSL